MYPEALKAKMMSRDESKKKNRAHTIMSAEEVAAGKKSYWMELEISGTIRNLSPKLWQFQHLTSLYLNDNNLTRLPSEISRLTSLQYLDLSCNKLRSLPAELGDLVLLRELLLNHNLLRVLPYELGRLFNLQVLGLKGNPLSSDLLALHSEPNGTQKLITFMLDNLAVSVSHPPQRPWIPMAHPDGSRPSCIFTVMCYNVLCDKYATRQVYGYCPTWALDWEYRKVRIMDQIRHTAADIITLQEVETEQFYDYFLPELKRDGYDGIFSPKSRAKTMTESERRHVDGCAIFFRTRKFQLVKEHLVEFNQLAMANHEGSDEMLNRVMTKDNIGLAALLHTKEPAWENSLPPDAVEVPLLVCTCHIHWDPEYCDVKLIQTMMLMNELKSIVEREGTSQMSLRPNSNPASTSPASNIQLMLCGDFNSLPNSGVIEFLSKSRVSADHPDFKGLGYKSSLHRLSSTSKNNEFTHPFHLSCAYSPDIMPYTNYTFDFKGMIDYIFHSESSIRTLGLLGPIDPDWMANNKIIGCPHPHSPSDHFPLLVQLEMQSPAQNAPSNGLILPR